MRKSALIVAIGLGSALIAGSAHAESRQDRLHRNIDRSIQDQQRQQQIIQQNQFETNQMRQNIDRNNLFTPQPAVPGPGFDRR